MPAPLQGADEHQWNGLVDQLGTMGVSEQDIRKNEGFIKDFLGSHSNEAQANGADGSLAPPITQTLPTRRNVCLLYTSDAADE